MVGKNQKRLILGAILLICALPLSAQSSSGQTDSLVRLMNAQYIEQVETDGRMARKAIFPTFLHNGTYLICDTALWHVDEKLINCFGNVQLMQGESVLTSETLDYFIDQDLAQFRGGVVQLRNKQDNVLRTRILDYNTKDSLATFRGGASMIGEDGQIIESDDGTYSNSLNRFNFLGHVNMFTDSVFVRTDVLDYDSNTRRADFRSEIDFWKDGDMLSAGSGWYERSGELFFFRDAVHGLGRTQETWSDSLFYYRNTEDILMLGNVQIQDQSRKVAAMGDRLHYVDSLSRVVLEERASAAIWNGQGEHPDTTYLGASRFVYHTEKMCDIPEEEIQVAGARLEEMLGDPVTEYRRRAAREAAQAAEQARQNDPTLMAEEAARRVRENAESSLRKVPEESRPELDRESLRDTLSVAPDSLGLAGLDSTSFAGLAGEVPEQLDTLPPPPDTTKIGFLLATGDIRIFRKDMQVRCDSLRYSDLDSIARLYRDPVVWNEMRRQYNSDSLFVLIRDDKMERASLMSNAFIHTEEADGYFDQIKSTDVLAYFSDSTSLRRFDALGGVTSLLYLEENETIATVNKTESQMMMATFDKDGNVDHVYNFDSPKSDAYPVVQLPRAEHTLKGFNWQPERRPKNKFDVTSIVVRDSEREIYEAHPQAEFKQTEIYFPGHMKEVYAALEAAKTKRNARPAAESPADTLAFRDSSVILSEAKNLLPDSLAVQDALRDSLSVALDTTSFAGRDSSTFAGLAGDASGESPADTTWMSDRELRRALRIAKRDARWAELDQRDADKAARREARKAERKARRAARVAAAEARQAEIDAAKLQKYIDYYTKQKERHEGRKQKPEPAGERPPGIEAGGELPPPVEPEREAP
jgi:lipopolysaccharide export system protein LptA